MGYMRHHTIVVCGWDEQAVQDAHAMALRLFAIAGQPVTPQRASLVSPIIPAQVNGYAAFFVAPDGSKEGWEPSHDADNVRELLVRYLRATSLDWVEVQFGDDEGKTKVVATRNSASIVDHSDA